MLKLVGFRSLRALAITALGTIMAFISQIAVARVLDVGAFGHFAYVMTLIGIFIFISQFGFDYLLMRFIPIYGSAKENGKLSFLLFCALVSVFMVGLALSAGTAVFFMVFQNNLWEADFFDALWAGTLLVPFLATLYVAQAALIGTHRVALGKALTEIARPVLFLMGLGVLIYIGAISNAADAIYLSIVVTLILLAVGWGVLRRVLPNISFRRMNVDGNDLKKWFGASLPLFIFSIPTVLIIQIDTLFLGAIIGPGESGTYWAATKVASLVAFPLYAANMVVAPILAKDHADGASLLPAMRAATLTSLVMCILILAVLVLFGDMVLALFGEEFVSALPVVYIIASANLIATILGPVDFALTMTGHERFSAVATSSALVVCVALHLILIPQYGAIGAAVSTAISIILMRLFLAFGVWRYHGILFLLTSRSPETEIVS